MPIINVNNLTKTYRDGTHAAKGVSFTVQAGEIFGLLGPNGAGKTTTMRILGTLHGATSGSATVLGLDVMKQAKSLRKRIGFAMQEVGMDDLATAQEMLMFHASLYGLNKAQASGRCEELLQTFDLLKHRDRRVTRFSGGMQRRLDLAVSLIHTPEVLFLDEPSTGLDPKSRSDLWKILRRLQKEEGLTILMSTHYMEEADALCDRIAIMNAGEIVTVDTPENLKRSVGADIISLRLDAEPSQAQQDSMFTSLAAENVTLTGKEMSIKVEDGSQALMPTLQVISDNGLRAEATKVRSPTLDDVFLQYTGIRLEEE